MRELAGWLIALLLIAAVIAVPITLAMSYDYRWKRECFNSGGITVKATRGESRLCIRGPIEIIPIAVAPW